MKKATPPTGEKANENQDANITQNPAESHNVLKNNDGEVAFNPKDQVSESSNNLSSDFKGSTQFVNADTHGASEDDHMVLDSTNTIDETIEEAQKKIEEDTDGDYKVGENKADRPPFTKPL